MPTKRSQSLTFLSLPSTFHPPRYTGWNLDVSRSTVARWGCCWIEDRCEWIRWMTWVSPEVMARSGIRTNISFVPRKNAAGWREKLGVSHPLTWRPYLTMESKRAMAVTREREKKDWIAFWSLPRVAAIEDLEASPLAFTYSFRDEFRDLWIVVVGWEYFVDDDLLPTPQLIQSSPPQLPEKKGIKFLFFVILGLIFCCDLMPVGRCKVKCQYRCQRAMRWTSGRNGKSHRFVILTDRLENPSSLGSLGQIRISRVFGKLYSSSLWRYKVDCGTRDYYAFEVIVVDIVFIS